MRAVKLVLGSVLLGLALLSPLLLASDPETWPIVYQDDFEDPASGWLTGETEYASRAYVDGAYEIQVKDAWRIVWSRIPGDREYLDFVAEAAFRIVAGEGEAGFLFRYQDSDNFYCFTVSTRGEYRLLRLRYNEWESLINWTSLTELDPTGWNRLQLVAQGDGFLFFLNGELLAEFSDDVFRSGELALCAITFEEPALVVRFDDLVVREDPQVRALAERAQSLFDQGARAYRSWNLEDAVEDYEQALSVYRALEWKEKEADCHLGLGNCWYLLSDFHKAVEHYQESLAINREIGDRQGEATSLMGLGPCYEAVGHFLRALEFYEQSLVICRELGDREGEAISLMNLGRCYYYYFGDYERAIEDYQQSLAVFRQIRDRQGEANSLGNLGLCYEDLGDYWRAIDYHQQSLAIKREIGDPQGEAASLDNLGRCYHALGDYRKAIDYHEESLAIYREIGDRWGEVQSLLNLGSCYYALGAYQQAIEYFQASLQVMKEIAAEERYPTRAPETLWRLYTGLGFSYQALGDLPRAAQAWRQAVEAIEWMRGCLARVEFKTGFMEEKYFVYRELVPTLVELGEPGEAVFYAERAKARTLVDMMETVLVRKPELLPATVQTASQALRQLSAVAIPAELEAPSGQRSGLERAAQLAREELEEFLSHLSRANPVLSDTLSVDPDRIASYMEDVQGNLGAGEIILE
ncbi:MAG: hypothetical protein DRI26_03560, partial [Chloroflexi bacterium]